VSTIGRKAEIIGEKRMVMENFGKKKSAQYKKTGV